MDTTRVSESCDLGVLHEVYGPAVIESISTRAKSDKGLRLLLEILTGANEHLAIDRIHFAKCLRFAQRYNGLDNDRLRRLRNPENFAAWRAVRNELLVPYFFAKRLRLHIAFTVNPTGKGHGDFQVMRRQGKIVVEVKTPRGDDPNLEGPQDTVHDGLDEELLKSAFFEGAGQLEKGNQNLIVLCTELCAWIHDWTPLEKLLYGQEIITASVDPTRGQLTEPRTEFRADGELNKHRRKRYTRVSAVASFRTDAHCAGPFDPQVMQVQFTVLHNYFAVSPISPRVFAGAEQFVPIKRKRGFKHVNRGRSTLLLYMGETRFQNVTKHIAISINGLYRRVRRFYWRIKIRQVVKAMKSELPDDSQSTDFL